jgi:uncharacterized protein (TIGR00255 family)
MKQAPRIASMTAFARHQIEHDWGQLVWEMRTVNHRYLEPTLKLPDSLRSLEPRLRELLRNTLTRGKFEAQLRFQSKTSIDQQLKLNQTLLFQLRDAAEKVGQSLDQAAAINPMELLRWPGVIQEQEQDLEAIEAEALALFQTTLQSLTDQRLREGEALVTFILQRLDNISAIVKQVREAMPAILARQRDKLASQLAQLNMDLDQGRLEQEVALLTQKADIHEEIDRLDTHVKEVAHTLRQGGAVGRRLDFLMQELNREANTLSAKSVVSDTTMCAVELKVLIEQMREQIQNIE